MQIKIFGGSSKGGDDGNDSSNSSGGSLYRAETGVVDWSPPPRQDTQPSTETASNNGQMEYSGNQQHSSFANANALTLAGATTAVPTQQDPNEIPLPPRKVRPAAATIDPRSATATTSKMSPSSQDEIGFTAEKEDDDQLRGVRFASDVAVGEAAGSEWVDPSEQLQRDLERAQLLSLGVNVGERAAVSSGAGGRSAAQRPGSPYQVVDLPPLMPYQFGDPVGQDAIMVDADALTDSKPSPPPPGPLPGGVGTSLTPAKPTFAPQSRTAYSNNFYQDDTFAGGTAAQEEQDVMRAIELSLNQSPFAASGDRKRAADPSRAKAGYSGHGYYGGRPGADRDANAGHGNFGSTYPRKGDHGADQGYQVVRRGGRVGFGKQHRQEVQTRNAGRQPQGGWGGGWTSCFRPSTPALPPPKPQNDKGGRIVARGTKSQYTFEGGQVACTSICLVAAKDLVLPGQDWSAITGEALDNWVEQGIARHHAHGKLHSSLEDLWGLDLFKDITEGLEMCAPLQGTVSKRQTLWEVFTQAYDLALERNRSLAMIFTKSGETVLVAASPRQGTEWLLLDSHGQSHEKNKLAYLKQFGNLDAVVSFLIQKYPPQNFGDGSFQSEMYDLFEAFPIVMRDNETEECGASPGSDKARLSANGVLSLPAYTNPQNEPDVCVPPTTEVAPTMAALPVERQDFKPPPPSNLKPPPPASLASSRQSESNSAAESFINRSDYEDPVTYVIMADPVTCQDGHTYERTVIERCFAERIEAEEKRRQKERSDDGSKDDDTSCGRSREPIQLISPISNKIVSDTLVPNFTLEQQIVRLMEANAFDLPEDEIAEWKDRRDQKKQRDKRREEEERQERMRIEEMRKNAEEAEKRNGKEERKFPAAPPPPADESKRVRVDRHTHDPNQRLSAVDTGLSCALAEPSMRIPKDIAVKNGSVLRCMVHRCTARMEGSAADNGRWCGRCARIVCDDCLAFDATDFDFTAGFDNHAVHRVCLDCVVQMVDVMEEAGDIHLKQKRVLLLRQLEPHMARLANRAALSQEGVVRHEAEKRYAPQVAQVERTIDELEHALVSLRDKVEKAAARAVAAREDCDEGNTEEHAQPPSHEQNAVVEKLRAKCETLEQELAAATAESAPLNDEEAAIRYMEKLSDISCRLDDTRFELATAMSNLPQPAPVAPTSQTANEADQPKAKSNPGPRDADNAGSAAAAAAAQVEALEAECRDLVARFTALFEGPDPVGEEASLNRAVEVSSVSSLLEDAQTRLAMAQSRAEAAADSAGGTEVGTKGSNKEAPKSAEPAAAANSADAAIEDLKAIGTRFDDWPLPLGLKYPTPRMERQLEILKNTLELRKVESEQVANAEWTKRIQDLETRQDALEVEIAETRKRLADAEHDAEEEERQAAARAEERRRREEERLERERQLREAAEKAERERLELLRRHEEEEEATRAAFAKVAGEDNEGAKTFGGAGDLRMCRRCKAGPIENRFCRELDVHNNEDTDYKGDSVFSKSNPNHCPNCDWFDADWHQWPYWDGVYGPH